MLHLATNKLAVLCTLLVGWIVTVFVLVSHQV